MSKQQMSEFSELAEQYHKCLNSYYDKFFDGQTINFDNACSGILEKLKNVEGGIYNKFHNEYLNYKSDLEKNKNK